MIKSIIEHYVACAIIFGVYGFVYSAFDPELQFEKISGYISLLLFSLLAFTCVWFLLKNKNKNISKINRPFNRPFNYYCFTFIGVPILLGMFGFLHHKAWSMTVASIYTIATNEAEIISTKITRKERWGKNDRHEKIFISGYTNGFNVSEGYYQSVDVGQTIKISLRKSKLGSHVKFLKD
jgi:hypothetical protein